METQDSSMKKKVISYYNKSLKFYESLKVVENQSNSDIIGSCKRYLGLAPVNEAMPCVGREIRIIGDFDDEDVKQPLISYDDPVIVVDCDEILRSRFPQFYEQASN